MNHTSVLTIQNSKQSKYLHKTKLSYNWSDFRGWSSESLMTRLSCYLYLLQNLGFSIHGWRQSGHRTALAKGGHVFKCRKGVKSRGVDVKKRTVATHFCHEQLVTFLLSFILGDILAHNFRLLQMFVCFKL